MQHNLRVAVHFKLHGMSEFYFILYVYKQVHGKDLKSIELTIREVKDSIPIFFTRMAPACFFEVGNIASTIPLEALSGSIVLCVSAIGSAAAFVQGIEKVPFLLSCLSHANLLVWL